MVSRNPFELGGLIKRLALEAGFDLAGVALAGPSEHADAYRDWIAAGKHGEMEYLARNVEEHVDVTRKFPWAKSILCVGLAYFQEAPDGETPQCEEGKIARYAWGRDYHKVVAAKLKQVEEQFRAALGDDGETLHARAYCDTGPILERELAQRAGLGWVGKHTLLIHPRHGSWFVLGELVLSVELAADTAQRDHCGTCRRCIEACPTAAITPYSVDAVKCISYQTLENRADIPPAAHGPMREAGFLVGCDICQEVCPFNRHPLAAREPDFTRAPVRRLSLPVVAQWDEGAWDEATRGRAFRRTKLAMFKRNAEILWEAVPGRGM